MTKFNRTNRANAKQALYQGIERRRRPRVAYRDYPASFVTQVMDGRAQDALQPSLVRPPRNPALEAYRSGARVTVRRAPAGLTHTQSI